MAVTFNNRKINHIIFNGQTVENLVVDSSPIDIFSFDEAIFDKTEFSQSDILYIMENGEKGGIELSNYTNKLVGKLITGLSNSLYSGKYRIIGVNHDGTYNTIDVLTEDCVTSMKFGSSNRHYNDSGCTARQYVEDTFYNAFDSSIKEHIKPMRVEYRYSTSNVAGIIGTLQTTTAYGKLLSYNELGTTYASSENSYDTEKYTDAGSEGNKYPYFNTTGSTLGNLRIKKYNGTAVYWWLRSRHAYYTDNAGIIATNGKASSVSYNSTIGYLVPAIRLKVKSKYDSLFDKASFSYSDIVNILNSGADLNKFSTDLIGKLVSGLTNSLYSGAYRIIGVNHDGTVNTLDLLTEDCVQQASSGFSRSSNPYNDANCYARIFVEDTFYNAFDTRIKEHIKPMEVKYYYKNSLGATGGTLQTTTAYGKLLSYNELGTTYASSTSQGDKYQYCQNDGAEGNKYPYFNTTGYTLCDLRIKKYNGTAVGWWLRSRHNNATDAAGIINTNGTAYYGNCYLNTTHYLAPVIRIGK